MTSDDDLDFTVTPFDPDAGIWFKYGTVYTDRERQLAAFQQATGFTLPG